MIWGHLEERVLSITLSMHSAMKQLDDFVESAFEIFFDLRQQVTLYPHVKDFLNLPLQSCLLEFLLMETLT